MKIGLLICDHVNKELLHIQGSYPDMFKALLPTISYEIYYVCDNQFPASADVCDAWVANGSRYSVYDEMDWIIHLKTFVQEIHAAGKSYIGVCFGHQLLAEALGGRVAKSAEGWCVGVYQFQIIQKEEWMQPDQSNFNLLMMCQDQVQELPPDSQVLAQTALCPIAMFQVGERMLGIQAHPEYSKAYDRALMEARVDRMGIDTVNKGLQSLAEPVDKELIASWMLNFLFR